MNEQLILCNRLKEARASQHLSQAQLAKLVGVSRNTISSIETGQFNPTAKLALLLCIALDWKFEDLFYFTEAPEKKKALLLTKKTTAWPRRQAVVFSVMPPDSPDAPGKMHGPGLHCA